MDIIDIINKKRLGGELTKEEIDYVITNFTNKVIADYQMSSLLMAITINGMSDEEVFNLTEAMINSGSVIDLSVLGSNVVDKHSTGGVGDKTTLIVAPIVAICGVRVAKMSGRGLGHTGGTIDKLESIPNIKLNLTKDEFIKEVQDINLAITSQTEEVAVADKKIYALRDVCGCVESIPLIASYIMSKKIALGSKKLVLDVKVGSGALIKNIDDARKLANLMIKIGKKYNMEVVCVLTNMDIPLGNSVGNSLEVEEAMNILAGNEKGHLYDLCIELASHMISIGLGIDYNIAHDKAVNSINNGSAYLKFKEMIEYQHGNINLLPKAKYVYNIKSKTNGYLSLIDAYKLGVYVMHLGAGRKNKEDKIDYSVGVILKKEVGEYINIDDVLMTVYTNKELEYVDNTIFEITNSYDNNIKLIYEVIK